jgi:hypothetical protein
MPPATAASRSRRLVVRPHRLTQQHGQQPQQQRSYAATRPLPAHHPSPPASALPLIDDGGDRADGDDDDTDDDDAKLADVGQTQMKVPT